MYIYILPGYTCFIFFTMADDFFTAFLPFDSAHEMMILNANDVLSRAMDGKEGMGLLLIVIVDQSLIPYV